MNRPAPKCRPILTALLLLSATPGFASPPASSDEIKDPGAALEQLTPKPLGQRVPVAIYAFRSEVQEVSAGGATDMFMTALIKSSQFRVVERARLEEGVVQEKKMNGASMTTGSSASHQLRGAQYIFEGAVTEANAGESARQGGINIGGLQLGGGHSRDSVAVDVRILDADTGDVLDAVNVRLPIASSNSGVSGTAALAGTLAAMTGRNVNPLTPDVSAQSSKRQGVDQVVRNAIETAVLKIVKHIDGTATTAGDKS